METIPSSFLLDEFKTNTGDPRNIYLKYLLNLTDNVETYITKKEIEKLNNNMCLKFACEKDENGKLKRVLVLPKNEKFQEKFKKFLDKKEKYIFLIPVMLISKGKCNQGINRSKHLNILLYNSYTHELERIDFKKQHLSGFTVKLLYKKIDNDFSYDILREHDPKIDFIGEIDISNDFLNRFDLKLRNLYPIYLICYLNLRLKYPKLKTDKIQEKLTKIKNKNINEYWTTFTDFINKFKSTKCNEEDTILNYENMSCIKKNSKNYSKILLEKNIKKCPENKIYNIFTNKCSNPKNIKDINIKLDEILKQNIHKNYKFISLGSGKVILNSMLYIFTKHPHGYLVNPLELQEKQNKSVNKNDFMIKWYPKDNENMTLSIPNKFWESWSIGLQNDKIRFIVSLISLTSLTGGFHANCLIFDKKTNEIERFDSIGSSLVDAYKIDDFDRLIKDEFDKQININVPINYKYITPAHFCPKIPFQMKELEEIGYDDTTGNCAVWRLWYIDIRLSNPTISRKELTKLAYNKIENIGSFQKFIKSYQAYIMNNIGL